MFEIIFSVVPPGGGEEDSGIPVSVNAVPTVGDFVRINDDKGGVDAFRVIYIMHVFDKSGADVSSGGKVVVQIEPVRFMGQMDQSGSATYGYYFKRLENAGKSELIQDYPNSGY